MPATAARVRLWPFAALSGTYFAHIGFFNPYLPLWLKELGLGLVAISLLTSLQSLTRLFAPYAWGWISDHSGERVRLLRFGAGVAFVAACLLFMDLSVAGLAVVLLIMFSHTGAMMPMSEAAMSHLVSRDGRFDAGRYGRVRLWGSLGFLLTVFLAGRWFDAHGLSDFPVWTVLTLALLVVSVWLLPDHREQVAAHAKAPTAPIGPLLRQAEVRWFFLGVFCHVLAQMGVYQFLSLYLDSEGYDKSWIGLLWAASVVAEVLWFYFQARWLKGLSLGAWLVVCSAVSVLRMGATAAWPSVWWLILLAQLLNAITFAAQHTVASALLAQHFPGNLRGRGQALYSLFGYGLTGVIGGVLGGQLSHALGLRSIFWAATLASVLAVLANWRVWHSHRASHRSSTSSLST